MIWATISSQSCFCLLDRAALSLAVKNIINLILVLTIWWCPFVESSPIFLEEGVCYLWPVHFLGKALLAFSLLRFILQGQTCLLLKVFLDFLLLHSSPLWWWKRYLLCVCVCVTSGKSKSSHFISFYIRYLISHISA